MKLLLLILVILTIGSTILTMETGNALGALGNIPEGDIEWVDPQEKTLGFAESFTRENFLIEASNFYENSVLITVYDNTKNEIIDRTIARKGDSWNVTDNANITRMNFEIKDLKEIIGNVSANEGLNVVVDQRVKIQTKLVGTPAPRLSIVPKERKFNNRTFVDRIFTPGSEISINFSIKNEGKATLRNVHLILDKNKNKSEIEFLFPGESLDRELPALKANNTNVINIRFRAPYVEKRRNFTISANVTGNDAFGRKYNATDSTYIIVRPFVEKVIEIQKFIPEKIYMGDFVYVALYIKNNDWKKISGVNLIEDIPVGFEPLDEMWNLTNFTLNGNENKLVMYKLRPKRPGIYNFPEKSSIVQWAEGIEYNTKSNKVIVSGPYVELKKSGIIEKDNIKINIDARNLGDRTAIVRFRDLIPNGTIVKSLVIRPGNTVRFSYTINKSNLGNVISDGKVTLPRANALVLDQFLYTNDRYTQRITSNDLILNLTK